ncbi:hypothetical protein ACVIYH_009117 [Bradyrhizobium diazoefficiens]
MAAFLDVCRFNPTAGSTTDWTYSSAVTGYQSPTAAGVVNGRLYKYRAESADLSQWEVGEGAYNTGTGVLARTTVLFNSSGTTSKINFSAAPQVAVVALKEDLISIEEANSFSTTQKTQARNNISVSADDSVAKSWAVFHWSGAAIVVDASYNVSSITRSSAGIYVVNYTTGFASANYACLVSTEIAGNTTEGAIAIVEQSTRAIGSVQIRFLNQAMSAAVDPTAAHFVAFGR